MSTQPRRSALWLLVGATVIALFVWFLPGCGGDDGQEDVQAGAGTDVTGTSEPDSTESNQEILDRQIADLDALLVEAIEAIGLDPAAARREMTPNSCVGAGAGTEGYNIRYYFDAPDYDQAFEQLAALEGEWEATDGIEITRPFSGDGEVADFLAETDELVLEAKRYPASEELIIGGSTGCW